MAAAVIYRGQTVYGKIQLRKKDECTEGLENPYPIPTLGNIVINFPGETSTVVLSTANPGEIAITDSALSTISFVMSPAKSALLLVTTAASVDTIVTDVSGNVDIFQQVKVFKISDIDNP
jgi:hypothetical protein